MKSDYARAGRKWLDSSSKYELDGLALKGLKIERVENGLILCNFVIPNQLSDRDGNWHTGAMATLIDDVAACTVLSFAGNVMASVDFSISHDSTAKIQEEVEIEANVVGQKGNLVSVVVDIRRKGNGEKIAVGKEWMSTIPVKGSLPSKL